MMRLTLNRRIEWTYKLVLICIIHCKGWVAGLFVFTDLIISYMLPLTWSNYHGSKEMNKERHGKEQRMFDDWCMLPIITVMYGINYILTCLSFNFFGSNSTPVKAFVGFHSSRFADNMKHSRRKKWNKNCSLHNDHNWEVQLIHEVDWKLLLTTK